MSAGLSQDELAERAGLSRRGISDLERGARLAPHPGTLPRLVEALELVGPARADLLEAAQATSVMPVALVDEGSAQAACKIDASSSIP